MGGRVGENMTRTIFYLPPDGDIREAWQVMKEEQFRHVPVLNDERLVGIFSDRDILLVASLNEDGTICVPAMKAEQVMKRHPISCMESTRIVDVAKLMVERKVDALPVVDERQKLVGMITSTDLIEILRDFGDQMTMQRIPYHYEILSLPTSKS